MHPKIPVFEGSLTTGSVPERTGERYVGVGAAKGCLFPWPGRIRVPKGGTGDWY